MKKLIFLSIFICIFLAPQVFATENLKTNSGSCGVVKWDVKDKGYMCAKCPLYQSERYVCCRKEPYESGRLEGMNRCWRLSKDNAGKVSRNRTKAVEDICECGSFY